MQAAERKNHRPDNKVKNQNSAPQTILVVEDDADLSQLICRKLQREGFQTEEALTGADAIAWLAENTSKLLLLDYNLPDMTGQQVIKNLAERKCQVPFILMTAYGDEKLAVKMMKLGARDYLVKDKGFGDLLARIVKQVIEQVETEQKLTEAEEALKRSEEKYRMLIDNMQDGIFIIQDSKMQFVNEAFAKMLGYTVEQIIGMDFRELVAPEDLNLVTERYFRKQTAANASKDFEFCMLTRDGKTRVIVNMNLGLIMYHDKVASIGTVKDITERKQAEEALQRAHADTQQLLSAISSILIGVGPDDRITRWNEAAENTFGIMATEVVGKPFLDCGINWDWIKVLAPISKCRDKVQSTRLDDIRFTRRDYKEGFLDVTINPVVSDSNEHAGYLLLAAEITERKNLESQLAQAQKLKSIGQLAAGIAHEINTPIQYVGDNTRFLQDAFDDFNHLMGKFHKLLMAVKKERVTEELLQELENALQDADMEYLLNEIPIAIQQSEEGVERVANIVRAMKEFSHPGGEEKRAINMNKAIESTITVARNEWKYVAEMVTDFDPSLPLVPCLPGDINQVILNLIINAAHTISEVQRDGGKGKGTIT
ncbi:MAG: PAS domain S-box protein, partial [bacterium]